MPSMSDSDRAPELRSLLRRELTARLEPDGWQPLSAEDRDMTVASFAYPLRGEFAAVAELWRALVMPDRPPVRITQVMIGVRYEPLQRMSSLLGDRFRHGALWGEVGHLADRQCEPVFEIATHAQVADAADEIARLLRDRGVPFAEEHASVEALLAAGSGHDDGMVPAVLAAAGRFMEARATLDASESSMVGELVDPDDQHHRRFRRQLRRWIDSEGDPALLPARPLPRVQRAERAPASERQRRRRDEREAIEATRGAATGAGRSEQRACLEAELARRGLSESPSWVEQTLDQLDASWIERTEEGARALHTLGKLGIGIVKAFRTGELPDLSTPEWLAIPDRAAL